MTNTAKKTTQEVGKDNAAQPSTPTIMLMVKIGFLKFFISAIVPKTGPISATTNVATEAAYPQ